MQYGEGYKRTLSNLVTLLSVDRAIIYQFSEDCKSGKIVASWGAELLARPPMPWNDSRMMDTLLEEGTWSVEDIEATPEHGPLVDNMGARSYLYKVINISGINWGIVGVHVIGRPHVWSSEDKTLLFGTAKYISDNLLSEALGNIALYSRIKRTKLLLQKVIDNTPVFLGIKNNTGKFILVNKALAEAAGYSHPRDMIGQEEWGDYFPPNSIEEESQVFTTGEKIVHQSVKGRDKWFTSMRVFIPGDNFLPPMVMSSLVDITELSTITRRLESFTHIASHDLQEPLRTITSFLGLLKKRNGAELSGMALHYVDTAIDASTRMGNLLSDLLAYSRLGSKPKAFAKVSLGDILMKALSNVAGKLIHISCPTIMYDPNSFPEIWGDEVQLITCLQNLLSNAVKFGNGSPVEIEHGSTPTHWEIRVVDHGIGIPEGMEEAIFKPFKRAHSDYEGTGMGLAIVEKVAHMHQGEAWASTTLGGGTTIHVTIKKQ